MTNFASEAPGARVTPWRREFFALMALGLPMAATQLVQFSINTVDVLMIGRLGPDHLAAGSLGLVVFYAMFLLGLGPAMAVTPLVSQSLGANRENYQDARRSVRMGLWASAIVCAPAIVIFFLTEELELLLGQPAHLAAMAEPYVLALAPGLPFALGVIVLRNYLAAIERTRAPLYFIIGTTFFNAFINWLLIYGNWGFPALGLVGAGIASSLSHALGFALLVLYARYEKESAKFDLFTRFAHPDWERLRDVFRLGWPIGVSFAFEAMLFNAAILLMGRIGVNEVAAYQIALNVAALGFMGPLGLSMAGATRIGLKAGARDRAGVRRAAAVSIFSCIGAIMIVAIPMMFAPHFIAGLYLNADLAKNAEVISLVAIFLPIAASFALFDAIQVSANQALRGLKDVRIPMVLTFISYWVIGFPVSAWLGLGTEIGAKGVWYGLVAGLGAASLMLGARLWRITNEP